ncbi:MAG TPA: FtsX-like permease family protein [Woeseiaceae bacterium]|nr:FtsX-like permease family protein [Woeseiaceae bacterium]
MFWNNVIIALRNLRKYKGFAAINITGLAIGLTIYVFGGLLVDYERTHDLFFENADRIYTIGATAAPELNVGVSKFNAVQSAVGPAIEANIPDVEAVARTLAIEYLVSMGQDSFYETIRFSDPALLDIFDLDYIHGDSSALGSPTSLLIAESTAIKYFGKTDVIGEVVTLDNEFDFHVAAVVADLPLNSHFTSSPISEAPFEFVAAIQALARMQDFDVSGDWDNLSINNMTYVMLPPDLDGAWLRAQMDELYGRIVDEDRQRVIANFTVHPLSYANTAIWDLIGLPVISVVSLLSFLVLVVACVNYTNLATAQSLGRSREVGMRKTMGAGQRQLLTQFLVESLVIAAIAMVIAIAALEVIIPLLNNAAGKALTIDYLGTLPWLVATTLLVGLLAGIYPAWLITRASPIDALRDTARKGRKGSRMRSVMIGAQFAISAFMLALVAIVFMQNEKIKESSYEFPRSEIYTLTRLNVDDVRERLDTLRHELEALPNVDSVGFSSQVPYEQNNSSWTISLQPGDAAGKFQLQYMSMSPEYFETYDIRMLAGRPLSRDIGNDTNLEGSEVVNVIVNEMALEKLGIATPAEAIGRSFYNFNEEDGPIPEFVIVGVAPTQNITGLFNAEKPWMYMYVPGFTRVGSVRITGGNMMDAVEQIEEVWDRVIPDYPMQGRFLDDTFNDVYNILKYMNAALAGFAFIAFTLALIGLFGLAAFMATQRTKEIGVRKVLGASSFQIARLLVWQFSTPVLWALAIALPGAYFASSIYLNFFADRITMIIPVLVAAGIAATLLAWGTVAGHAIRIARANPVLALRYE